LKRHVLEFVQVAFLDIQDAEKDFAWLFVTFKHRFIDFNKVAFLDVQKAIMSCQGDSPA
jgi:hypothetical protein